MSLQFGNLRFEVVLNRTLTVPIRKLYVYSNPKLNAKLISYITDRGDVLLQAYKGAEQSEYVYRTERADDIETICFSDVCFAYLLRQNSTGKYLLRPGRVEKVGEYPVKATKVLSLDTLLVDHTVILLTDEGVVEAFRLPDDVPPELVTAINGMPYFADPSDPSCLLKTFAGDSAVCLQKNPFAVPPRFIRSAELVTRNGIIYAVLLAFDNRLVVWTPTSAQQVQLSYGDPLNAVMLTAVDGNRLETHQMLFVQYEQNYEMIAIENGVVQNKRLASQFSGKPLSVTGCVNTLSAVEEVERGRKLIAFRVEAGMQI